MDKGFNSVTDEFLNSLVQDGFLTPVSVSAIPLQPSCDVKLAVLDSSEVSIFRDLDTLNSDLTRLYSLFLLHVFSVRDIINSYSISLNDAFLRVHAEDSYYPLGDFIVINARTAACISSGDTLIEAIRRHASDKSNGFFDDKDAVAAWLDSLLNEPFYGYSNEGVEVSRVLFSEARNVVQHWGTLVDIVVDKDKKYFSINLDHLLAGVPEKYSTKPDVLKVMAIRDSYLHKNIEPRHQYIKNLLEYHLVVVHSYSSYLAKVKDKLTVLADKAFTIIETRPDVVNKSTGKLYNSVLYALTAHDNGYSKVKGFNVNSKPIENFNTCETYALSVCQGVSDFFYKTKEEIKQKIEQNMLTSAVTVLNRAERRKLAKQKRK